MLPARALVRSLSTFLAGSRACSAQAQLPRAPLRRSLSLSSAALPPPLRRGLLAPPLLPPAASAAASALRAGAVRWGSRKAGSTGFKTKSSIKKRFRVTGGGALRRLASGKRHLNLHKSSSRIRRLGAPAALLLPRPARRLARQPPFSRKRRFPPPLTTRPRPPPLTLSSAWPAGVQKTIKNKGLRKRYLRVFGLSPFHK